MTQSNGIIIETLVTDDGAPANPGEVAISWQFKSGPVVPVIESPNSATTAINWGDLNVGIYKFQINARDGEFLTRMGITLEVLGNYEISGNVAPQVDVGGPYVGVVVGQPLQLEGEDWFNDNKPGNPGYTTVEWLKHSGPGHVVFSDASSYTSQVTFSAPGDYVLRLTADDGDVKVYEDVTITVAAANGPTTPLGTPHSWLQNFGVTNNFEAAELLDHDGDGSLTWEEFLAGTDPTDPASVFCIMKSPMQGSGPELSWFGTLDSGVTNAFLIFRCTNLAQNVWTQIASRPRHASGTNTWTDTGFNGSAYYRIGIAP